ncbi:acyl-CoA synthetase [soil metagenome]
MYIGDHARTTPDKPALISVATGEVLTYADLDARSNRLAQYLYARGLRRGDCLAVLMENRMCFPEVAWAAFRSGLYLTPINRYLPPDEVAFIVDDCDAKAIVVSDVYRDIARTLEGRAPQCQIRLMVGASLDGWTDYETTLASQPARPLETQWLGDIMLYSSGTTGRPSGIRRPLEKATIANGTFLMGERMSWFGFSRDSVYLTTAPLYHSAPLAFTLGTQHLGGTVVMQEKFDAETALSMIERYKVTHSQWVPTMFIRMLKLPEEVRKRYDMSSLEFAIHASAPCPIEVKQKMIDWWGDRIHEYYGATERVGTTYIDSAEWRSKPGSVGRPRINVPHICDDLGREVDAGVIGQIYFEQSGQTFEYHKNPAKTLAAQHPKHPSWLSVGDIGYLDSDGYLFLTGRKAFTIISGGVNIYPQAIEDALALHPSVNDAAVFGVPDAEYGESVKAVIELLPGASDDDAMRDSIRSYLRTKVAGYMIPKSIDFIAELPRLPTGKLYKQGLMDAYRQDDSLQHASRARRGAVSPVAATNDT